MGASFTEYLAHEIINSDDYYAGGEATNTLYEKTKKKPAMYSGLVSNLLN